MHSTDGASLCKNCTPVFFCVRTLLFPPIAHAVTDDTSQGLEAKRSANYSSLGQRPCTNCSSGHFASGHGLDTCEVCPPGKFSKLLGAMPVESCQHCTSGRTSVGSATTCVAWNAAFFMSAHELVAGPLGKTATSPSMSVCTNILLVSARSDRMRGMPSWSLQH